MKSSFSGPSFETSFPSLGSCFVTFLSPVLDIQMVQIDLGQSHFPVLSVIVGGQDSRLGGLQQRGLFLV